MADNGFASATITYTLYAKGKNFGCDGALPNKIKSFQYAVNDLWLATSFFIKNAKKYNIDTEKIFVAGSSAGAETVLHGAYWDFKTMNLYDNSLPAGFKYDLQASSSGNDQYFSTKMGISYNFVSIYGPDKPKKPKKGEKKSP